MDNDVKTMTFGDKLAEFLEISIVNTIAKGLRIVATIIFGLAAIIFGFIAMFSQQWYLYFSLFIIFGLIAGVCGGFFNYLYEEY